MPDKFRGNRFLAFALLWLLSWFLPWTTWLDALPWFKLGLAMLLFMVPGITLSIVLLGRRLTLLTHLVSGLALSVFVVACLGFLGRVLHLPFDLIRPIFVLFGLADLAWLYWRSSTEPDLWQFELPSAGALACLLLLATLGTLVNLQSRFGGDDFSYLAYLTVWQHAQPLNFQEVIFGSGGLDALRFWTAMFPMSTAFLAQLSAIPGLLLLGIYLEPYLIAIALVSAFNLYKDLLRSDGRAGAALLLQFTFFYLMQSGHQPGNIFFARLSEDKSFAAFILAPLFFVTLRFALQSWSYRSGVLLLLIGLCLSLTHPIILAFTLFIAAVYLLIVTLLNKDFRKLVELGLLLSLTLVPAAPLRFVRVSSAPKAYELESALERDPSVTRSILSYFKGTPFYGFMPKLIQVQALGTGPGGLGQMLLSWSYLGILLLGLLWSLIRLRTSPVAPFLVATSLLVLLCVLPYTGWLVGYLVTARMLWRSPWLMPIGLTTFVLLIDLLGFALRRTWGENDRLVTGLIVGLSLAALASSFAFAYTDRWQRVEDRGVYTQKLATLAALGEYLESTIEEPSKFVADPALIDYLPGISSKSKPVFFRSAMFTPGTIKRRFLDRLLTPDPSVTVRRRTSILDAYQIHYLVVQDVAVKDLYLSDPHFLAHRFEEFWIIEFLERGGG